MVFFNFEAGQCEKWIKNAIQNLTVVGSTAYLNRSIGESNDVDIHGICLPPVELITQNPDYIEGFDKPKQIFKSWANTRVKYNDDLTFDIHIMSLNHFFNLIHNKNSHTILETLYFQDKYDLFTSDLYKKIKNKREIFISQKIADSYFRHAESYLNRNDIEKFKAATHMIRFLFNAIYILKNHEIDHTIISSSLREIREGKCSIEDALKIYMQLKEDYYKIKKESTLQETSSYKEVKLFLKELHKEHY